MVSKLPGSIGTGRVMAVVACGFVAATACGGVSPDPARAAERLPPAREFGERERLAVTESNERAERELATGDSHAAAASARDALAVDPRDALARALHGMALMGLARQEYPPTLSVWREAEGEFVKAAALAPEDPRVAAMQGRFLASDGHLSAAAAAVERGLAAVPDDLACLRLASAWRYELGEERAARPHLERLLELVPDDPIALYRLGMCRLVLVGEAPGLSRPDRARDLAAAVELFDRYLTLVQDDPHGYLAATNAALRAADAADAGAEPDLRSGFLERATAWAAQGRARFPRRPELCFLAGLVAEAAGDDDGAIRAHTAGLDLDPGHAAAGLNLARLLFAKGDDAAARQVLQQLLDADPRGSDLTADERRRIRSRLDADSDAAGSAAAGGDGPPRTPTHP